jgi:colanic acid/amylovoran biosynthesis glycosyltransferase
VRIGYLIPEFPGQTHVFFWREIQALRARGVEVRLLSTRRPTGAPCRHEFAEAAAQETHYVFPPQPLALADWVARRLQGLGAALGYLNGLATTNAQGLKGRLRGLGLLLAAADLAHYARRERLEHIHVHSCADAAHLVALCRRLGGPPYSLTLHGDLGVYGGDHGAKMEGAAFVDAVGTHLLKQIVAELGLPAGRVHVTCMGVDTARLAQLGAVRIPTAGKLHVVTVARLNRMKGHVHALAAVRQAVDAGADVRYTIAGEGENRAEIEARIGALGLQERVRMAGTLSESEVLALLGEADAFLLPSVGAGEAWPVSVMEAMAAGLPVISSIIGATPEMIVSGVDGILVGQGDEGGLAAALVHLAHDLEARAAIGRAARLTAQRRFDVGVTAGRLADEIQHSAPCVAPHRE